MDDVHLRIIYYVYPEDIRHPIVTYKVLHNTVNNIINRRIPEILRTRFVNEHLSVDLALENEEFLRDDLKGIIENIKYKMNVVKYYKNGKKDHLY